MEPAGSGLLNPGAVTAPPAREIVVPDIQSMVRWYEHDYPHPLARWHTHREAEVHLIRHGTGLALVGDHISTFSAGHLYLVGRDLPHNWVSDTGPDEVVRGRDVVLHVDIDKIEALAEIAPEAADAITLLETADRGIEFTGRTREAAGAELEAVGRTSGLERLVHLFALFRIMATAPAQDRSILASATAVPPLDAMAQRRIDEVLRYVVENSAGQVRLADAAQVAGMEPTAFSRFFKRSAGVGFAALVRRMRVLRACRLLAETSASVADICHSVGYENLSNFNRQFRAETGTTPSRFRRMTRATSG